MDIDIATQNAIDKVVGGMTQKIQVRYVVESRIDFNDSDKNETLISMEFIQHDKDDNGHYWTSYPEKIDPDSDLGKIIIANNGRLIPLH